MSVSERIEQIQHKLLRLQQTGIQYVYFRHRTEPCSYALNPSASVAEVELFEQTHGITLPEGYREFLLKISNGSSAGPYYGFYHLDSATHRYLEQFDPDYLKKPFPLTEELIFFKYCSQGEGFAEWTYKREDEEYRKYVDERARQLCSPFYVRGTIELSHYGCGIFFFLVVNGQEYGNVWVSDITNEGGIFPLRLSKTNPARVDFLTWYEMWLDHNLREIDEDRKIDDYSYWSDYWWLQE